MKLRIDLDQATPEWWEVVRTLAQAGMVPPLVLHLVQSGGAVDVDEDQCTCIAAWIKNLPDSAKEAGAMVAQAEKERAAQVEDVAVAAEAVAFIDALEVSEKGAVLRIEP